MKVLSVEQSTGLLHMTLDQIKFFLTTLKETLESFKSNHKCFIFGYLNYNLFQQDNDMVSDLLDIMSDNLF